MNGLFAIRREVSRQTQVGLAVASWSLLLFVWFGLTHWAKLPPFALPRPEKVLVALGQLWTQYDLMGNVFMSWWRIAQAFFWCVVIAVPLGLFMGSFRWLHHFINPLAAPMRSMPITAFLPAFLALFGMEETMKVAFLWFGMFFYLLATVVEEGDIAFDPPKIPAGGMAIDIPGRIAADTPGSTREVIRNSMPRELLNIPDAG